jgi:hypothetical protein
MEIENSTIIVLAEAASGAAAKADARIVTLVWAIKAVTLLFGRRKQSQLPGFFCFGWDF